MRNRACHPHRQTHSPDAATQVQGPELANDIKQEALYTLLVKLRRFDIKKAGSVRAFALSIANNLALAEKRRKRPQNGLDAIQDQLEDPGDDPQDPKSERAGRKNWTSPSTRSIGSIRAMPAYCSTAWRNRRARYARRWAFLPPCSTTSYIEPERRGGKSSMEWFVRGSRTDGCRS